jgi:hypothetical protein
MSLTKMIIKWSNNFPYSLNNILKWRKRTKIIFFNCRKLCFRSSRTISSRINSIHRLTVKYNSMRISRSSCKAKSVIPKFWVISQLKFISQLLLARIKYCLISCIRGCWNINSYSSRLKMLIKILISKMLIIMRIIILI